MIRIAIAQINPTVGDLKGNQRKIFEYLDKSQKQVVDLVVFPELAVCGYPPEDLLHKDHFVQDNLKILKSIVAKVQNRTVIVGFVDMDKEKKIYNAAAVIKNKKIISIYHKRRLPNYGVFDEKRYFSEGKNHCLGFTIKGIKCAINICEDIWVEEGVYLEQARKGAKVIINLSCSPFDIGKQKAREKLLFKRANQTKAYICYLNIIGGQDELVFDGNSMFVSPQGEILLKAAHCKEDLLICDIPSGETFKKVPKGDRLEQIYKVLVLGTRDYIVKNGFKKVVIGLSGGIDSAMVATIAVDAIGKENVIGVSMPSRYSSQGTQTDAKKVARNLGIEFKEISIENIFTEYLKTLTKEFVGTKTDATEENIQARIRGNILMALSNKFNWLVLTTGNKSEVAVGYCTLYGDMSGGFAAIKDVPKILVYELAEYRNNTDEIIPNSIIQRPPTAELRSGQKDQDSLPVYELLDEIIEDYIEKHKSVSFISKGKNKKLIKKIIKMIDYSEYKRRQAPPGIKITSRAFGRDWRLPITNKYKEF